MYSFPKATAISAIKEPLHWTPEKSKLMVEACREMASFHQEHCKDILFLYKRYNFKPETIREEVDLTRIPCLGVTAMKHFLLTSLPHEKAVLKLTSSGTRGQKTQIWFDQSSLDRCQSMMDGYWEQEQFISEELTNYLVFTYDPDDAKDLGIAFSDKNQLRFAPVSKVHYAIKKNSTGDWYFDKEAMKQKLHAFAKDNKPVRIFGMPGFIYEFLTSLKEEDRTSLPPKSLVITGGGWKAAEDKKISKEDFRHLTTRFLGIPSENIRDGYGMAEHCAPYFECPKHRFHIAVYNRVIIRDPVSLKVCLPGDPGLLELITPWNAMMPNLAIISTDFGLIDREPCDCGYHSPTFSLIGRAGLTKHKGCAIHAADIVTRN